MNNRLFLKNCKNKNQNNTFNTYQKKLINIDFNEINSNKEGVRRIELDNLENYSKSDNVLNLLK